jgi:hypothetical protein
MTLPRLKPGQIWLTRDQSTRIKIVDHAPPGSPRNSDFKILAVHCEPGTNSRPVWINSADIVEDGYRIWNNQPRMHLTTLLYDPEDV